MWNPWKTRSQGLTGVKHEHFSFIVLKPNFMPAKALELEQKAYVCTNEAFPKANPALVVWREVSR